MKLVTIILEMTKITENDYAIIENVYKLNKKPCIFIIWVQNAGRYASRHF